MKVFAQDKKKQVHGANEKINTQQTKRERERESERVQRIVNGGKTKEKWIKINARLQIVHWTVVSLDRRLKCEPKMFSVFRLWKWSRWRLDCAKRWLMIETKFCVWERESERKSCGIDNMHSMWWFTDNMFAINAENCVMVKIMRIWEYDVWFRPSDLQ